MNLGSFHTQGTASGSVSGDSSLGYCFSDSRWQAGIALGGSYQFIHDSRDAWMVSSTPFLDYHIMGLFEHDAVVPFIGVFVGAIWNDDDATGTAGPRVGVKAFLSDQAFLVVRYRFEKFFGDLDLASGSDTSSGNHVGTVGIGFVWGGAERVRRALQEVPFVEQAERITKRAEDAAVRAEEAAQRAEEAREKAEKAGGGRNPASGEGQQP
jgi:hypothetical protein